MVIILLLFLGILGYVFYKSVTIQSKIEEAEAEKPAVPEPAAKVTKRGPRIAAKIKASNSSSKTKTKKSTVAK